MEEGAPTTEERKLHQLLTWEPGAVLTSNNVFWISVTLAHHGYIPGLLFLGVCVVTKVDYIHFSGGKECKKKLSIFFPKLKRVPS